MADQSPQASSNFRFRFLARGEIAGRLVELAVRSLLKCHPSVMIVLVDANDSPTLDAAAYAALGAVSIVHLRPGQDEVARAVGRGSREHLFYWRHSPQLMEALPKSPRFDVHVDADLLFVRSQDLSALIGPLDRGRIAATTDESSLKFYREMGDTASRSEPALFPRGGASGPLLQGGLLFRNAENDGGLLELFWERACAAARSGQLDRLPWNDMCLLTTLLTAGGPLWERLLILGHDSNYISDAHKDGGIFGTVLHFGGRNAQPFLLEQRARLFPAAARPDDPWGTVGNPPERGVWSLRDPALRLPFALTWAVPRGASTFSATLRCDVSAANIYLYCDGQLLATRAWSGDRFDAELSCDRSETVSLIAASPVEIKNPRVNVTFS